MPRYFTRSTLAEFIGPDDFPRVAVVHPSRKKSNPIGLAYVDGRVEGRVTKDGFSPGPDEATWMLTIDERCDWPPGPYPGIVRGEVVGRFVLRRGVFIPVAAGAILAPSGSFRKRPGQRSTAGPQWGDVSGRKA